jgi:tetratricopeptide (TPR) repeat protein
MFLSALLLSLSPAPAPQPTPQDRREAVTAKYHALFETQDAAGMRELWSENEGLVLQTIDADLEGSLSKWEGAKEAPPTAEIEALHARALFGARCASEALSRPIFLDYASSFVGWNDEQKLDFRAGQAVYGRAMQELRDDNAEVALEAARETVLRALPLGDWWGTAMGHGAEGMALQAMGELEDALSAYSRARLLNSDLGLQFSEYRNLQGMLSCLRSLERWQRALVVSESVVEYAKAFQDADGLRAGLTAQAELARKLGLEERAAAAKAALEALDSE